MKIIKRAALGFGIAAAATMATSAFAAQAVNVTIDAAKPGPVINKNIYGQFAEHLGSGIYGGMWVGPESKIPNTKGWRKDVVGALKDLHVPLVRWPGGCFADEYHWREGIGPHSQRPVKVNTNWGGVEENNAVGTHEFFDLVEQIGADVYVNGNLGTGTPQEMAEWIEYMTADGKSSLAQLRAKNGHPKPFKVAYFGVGNEAWGCGGQMTPEYYTSLYNHYATFIRAKQENMPKLIVSGGNDSDLKWTDYLSKNIRGNASAITFHYYTLPTGNWDKKGAATGFGEDQWFSTLKETLQMEGIIAKNVAKLEENDPKKKFTFIVDEWGTWYDPEPGSNPGFLVQQNSLRDALVAALNFNIFHAHADRVSMTNIAQMVNVLQAMILTDKDKMLLTPTYHAFKMYVPFQDATFLPVKLDNNPQYTVGGNSIPEVSASAARGKDGKLYLALVNTNPKEAVDVAVDVAGAKATSASGSVLTATAMDAHNTFASPKAVVPAPFKASIDGGKLTAKLPAKSVVVLAITE
jgi:alpha-L-arabinofuranosidase